MTLSLTLGCLWVLCAAITAMLPMRYQYVPGVFLLFLSVPLVVFIARQHGAIPVLLFLFALGSMFRRPLFALLRHFGRRWRERV